MSSPDFADLSARVAAFIAADHRGGERVGPFTIHFDRQTANIWRNYAVPDIGALPTSADVEALLAAFDRADRTPRLEYVPASAPAVEPALLAAGFTVEDRSPVLGCRAGEAIDLPIPDGISFALVADEADLLDVARLQHAGYQDPEPAGAVDVARLTALIGRGGIVALARDTATGEPIGTGLSTDVHDGASELAAVATAASHRRRGIGSGLIALLARTMHERGADLVWLEQEPVLPEILYSRAGFRRGAEKLWISRPAGVLVAGAARLHPVPTTRAQAILDGDLSNLGGARPGDGWPHADTSGGMWMVANKGVEGFLITLDGVVIGDAGAMTNGTEAMYAITLVDAYQRSDLAIGVAGALHALLAARTGVVSVANGSRGAADRRPPTLAASERDTLLAFLGYLRECLIGKLDDLSEEAARRNLVDSGTTLLGLVKHVAATEYSWLAVTFAGGSTDDEPDEHLSATDTVESVATLARAVGVRSEEIVCGCEDPGTLAASPAPASATRYTLRWILVHLVEEVGRHAGHADILRELIDGRVGR